MNQFKEVKAFETDDGQLFIKKEEAQRHYRERLLRKSLSQAGYTVLRANHFINRLQDLIRNDPGFGRALSDYLVPPVEPSR